VRGSVWPLATNTLVAATCAPATRVDLDRIPAADHSMFGTHPTCASAVWYPYSPSVIWCSSWPNPPSNRPADDIRASSGRPGGTRRTRAAGGTNHAAHFREHARVRQATTTPKFKDRGNCTLHTPPHPVHHLGQITTSKNFLHIPPSLALMSCSMDSCVYHFISIEIKLTVDTLEQTNPKQ
jgi:hypothetical protein